MMETITLRDNQTLHVAATGDNPNNSPVDEEQMMNLSDMTDLSQEVKEDIVTIIPKEVILISLVSQEQALYNPKHENYRNTQRKDMKWMEISENVGWTEMQCKAKWKAMRDQYCRELKRSKFNFKAVVKWKYFKELDFLRPYALARNYRPRNPPGNNNNSFNCSPGSTSKCISVANQANNNTSKFTTVKIEGTPIQNFSNCGFSLAKAETSNNLTEEQLSTVLQQQADDNNWTYITGSNNSSANTTRIDNHSLSDTQHLLSTHHHQHQSQQQTDEAFYNAFVDCVGQIQQQQQEHLCQQQSTSEQQQIASNIDEEDDDPIHTFLNIESYFEKELISLIQSEDVLYDSFNPNYRNVKIKLDVWDEIARKLKKTVKQCRLKWKALRDQFIREHKRLKNRDNIESLSRWKHYDALIFLQKFIKHKVSDYDSTKPHLQIPKTEIDADADMDDEDENINIGGSSSSPLPTPLDDIKCELTQPQLQIQHISGVTDTQAQANHQDSLCVSAASVAGYDDIDIDNYIMGDSGSVVDEHNDHDENEQETVDDHKSQPDFSTYSNHNTNISNDIGTGTATIDQTNLSINEQPQHISIPSLDLNDTSTALINTDNLTTTSSANNSYQQIPLTNGPNITLASAVTTLGICNSPPHPTTLEASTNTSPLLAINNNVNAVNQEDDEVGAFFKAIAMKIRNAKLSPVAFTDLQIDILRAINGSLRNH